MTHTGHKFAALISSLLLFATCRFDPSGLAPHGDGSIAGDATLSDAGDGPCVTGATRCHETAFQTCADGQWNDQAFCDLGCVLAPSPHCGEPRFSNGVALTSDSGTQDVVFPMGTSVINTDTGVITLPTSEPLAVTHYTNRQRDQTDAPSLRILGFRRLTIPTGALVRVEGSAALALVAAEVITIAGRLEAMGAPDGLNSPGGYAGGGPGSAGAGSQGGGGGARASVWPYARSGGGGGGLSGAGGPGGNATYLGSTATGGPGGGALAGAALGAPEPLVGGAGGGGGGDGGSGGAGGGALMLAARNAVDILEGGVVNVGGGGGLISDSGGGGGSGGFLLIQSGASSIAGRLVANGGGGAGAGDESAGSAGLASDALTPGGGSHGGSGGAGTLLGGTAGTQHNNNGGGGGGAAGRILVMTYVDAYMGGTSLFSPHLDTAAAILGILPVQ